MISLNPIQYKSVNNNYSSNKTMPQAKSDFKLSAPISKDTVSFTGIRPEKYVHDIYVEHMLVILKKNKFLNEHVGLLLDNQVEMQNSPAFISMRAHIIEESYKTMQFFKKFPTSFKQSITKKNINSKGEKPSLFNTIKTDLINEFGGEDGLGKYLHFRIKDKDSSYSKLAENTKKNDYRDFIDNLVSIVTGKKSYYDQLTDEEAKNFKTMLKNDRLHLTKEKCDKLSESLLGYDYYTCDMNAKIPDFVGAKLILPNGNFQECEQVYKYLSNIVDSDSWSVNKIMNFYSKDAEPYVSANHFSELAQKSPFLDYFRYNNFADGYTSFHMLMEKNGLNSTIPIELEIRSKAMDEVCEAHHLFYDLNKINEGTSVKDLSHGIRELHSYYKSTGIYKKMAELYKNEDDMYKYRYYLNDWNVWARNIDKGIITAQPSFPKELSKYESTLSIESMKKINSEAAAIESKYNKR